MGRGRRGHLTLDRASKAKLHLETYYQVIPTTRRTMVQGLLVQKEERRKCLMERSLGRPTTSGSPNKKSNCELLLKKGALTD